jgi:hypothetical protein
MRGKDPIMPQHRREFLVNVPLVAGLASATAAGAATAGPLKHIRRVDIIHHTHTDVGYTDLPSVVRDKQCRYIESAIDLCLGDKTFRWTVESLLGLDDWWKRATAARRAVFVRLVRAGQVDVMGMAFNQTPFLNPMQWEQMFRWIPADLWKTVNPRAAMQNDVNGMPRAGAMLLLDHGIGHLLMGINADSGGAPFRRPSAFWWKLPDGRRTFVWLGDHYGRAMAFLGVRKPELGSDDAAVRAAHATFIERLGKIEDEGYEHDRLILTFTHPSAYDNGSPFPPLAPFIRAWNKLGFQPELQLTTATEAVFAMEKAVGGSIPTMEGEFTDWWANGSASAPRELAGSRVAKRALAAAHSPVWGPMPADAAGDVEAALKDLCLFDEHTWGDYRSVSAPYHPMVQAQFVQKAELAWRPMGHAEWLLERRARTKIESLGGEGLHVANPSAGVYSGWASIAASALPADARSLVDTASGERIEMVREGGRARFWLAGLAPHSLRRFRPDPGTAAGSATAIPAEVTLDAAGWPVRAQWANMRRPLFDGALGHFIAAEMIPPADRRTIAGLHANPDAAARQEIRKKSLRQAGAEYEAAAKPVETAHTWVYSQSIRHPRLNRAVRTVELWKGAPRARVTVRFDRVSSLAPEVLYLAFEVPEQAALPVVSCGGVPFTPYREQLKGACRDYIGIDGWAHWTAPGGDGEWLWVTRDAPLVAVGGPHPLERHQEEPATAAARGRMAAVAFDNCWHTNFVADSNGTMEFVFELIWRDKIAQPGQVAEALVTEPVVMVRTAAGESPALLRNLYRP